MKSRICLIFGIFLVVSIVFDVPGGSGGPERLRAEQQKLYTAYNIWILSGSNMLFLNYKYGNFIPAGTEVANISINRHVVDSLSGESGDTLPSVTFTRMDNNKRHTIYYVENYHPGKSIDDYVALTFIPKDFDELTAGFKDWEISAIKRGIVVDGMSKDAVLVSYGLPPEHKTGSLDNDTWIYWRSSRDNFRLVFDESGFAMNTGYAGSTRKRIPPGSSRAAAPPSMNADQIYERLKVLSRMKSQGLVTDAEYEKKRKELIDKL